MKPILALACAFAVPASAQDKPPAAPGGDLPALRAAFAASGEEWTVVIALVQGGQPVLLTSGSEAGGKELSPQTLVPLFALAKVLAADAIHGQLKSKVDQGSGEKLGDRELTVRELLDGTPLLPDYFVLDGGEGTADAALLRTCGALVAGANLPARPSALGAPEFVLLEPLAFGARYQDWTSMLRSTLAPRVPGLDPVSADALTEAARGRTILAADDLAKLAAARPSLLRTMLSLQNAATWLQWRVQQEAPLWNSVRMGRMLPSVTRPKEQQRWMLHVMAMNTAVYLDQYPAKKAAFLWLGAMTPGKASSFTQLQRAFESDLFADGGEAASAAESDEAMRNALIAAAGPPRAEARTRTNASSSLAGTRWCTTPADASQAVHLAFGAAANVTMEFTRGGDSLSFPSPSRSGDRLSATMRGGDGGTRMLWLWPQPDFDKPTKLGVVLLTTRMSTMTTATGVFPCAAVPQYFELVPEAK